MKYINCERYATEILDEVKQVKHTKYFAIVSVGDNPASQSYIKGKIKDCEYCGIPCIHKHIDLSTEPYPDLALEYTLRYLANDKSVSAIILQLPLPEGWDEKYFLSFIPEEKDVDGFSENSPFRPCTPEGVVYVLKKELGDLTGKHALIIGRGSLVGIPLIADLLAANCTITVAHSKSNSEKVFYETKYDIVVCAAGHPNLLDLRKLKGEPIVIDVGVNKVNGKLCGDCFNFDEDVNKNMLVTPVPRGIGLMTRAILMKHIAEINQKEVEIWLTEK